MSDAPELNETQCPHTALAPHWDQPADMGKAELATYACEACHETFNYEQAQQYLNQAPSVLSSISDEARR